MLHAHAEAQGPHRVQVGDLALEFAQDQAQAGVVGGVEVGERLAGIAVAAPFDLREVGAVVEARAVVRRRCGPRTNGGCRARLIVREWR